jgi:beta-glucosidase
MRIVALTFYPGRIFMSPNTPEKQTTAERVQALLAQMTLKEKVSMLSGVDLWRTSAIERLGIPALVMSDGPHGVRSDGAAGRVKTSATSFPTGVSFASTWDPELIYVVGQALAEETLGLGCDILLGPCVNIVRGPLAGRNFEAYSEDPYLAGKIGAAWINGLQSKKVGASLKHYALNNQEYERFRGSSQVDERTMREIYLSQFEMAVKESQPWTVMCSYNRINGVYAADHQYLMTDILRKEWGFQGIVISDWTANHTITDSVKAGLDIEMPGPAKYYGGLLEQAVRNWQIDESVIDETVRRILTLIVNSGRMDDPSPVLPGSVNTPEHQALARKVAEESIVLLKNQGNLLPLAASKIKSIAVIGPNAAECRIGGGGSSYLVPPYTVSMLDGIKNRLGADVKVEYERGCNNRIEPSIMGSEFFIPVSGKGHGLTAEYFTNTHFSGTPIVERTEPNIDFGWYNAGPDPRVGMGEFSLRLSGKITPIESGLYTLTLGNTDISRLFLDGKLLLENNIGKIPLSQIWDDPSRILKSTRVELEVGKTYDLSVEYLKLPGSNFDSFAAEEYAGLHLRYIPPTPPDAIERAANLAARCDVAVIFAGMPTGFESEGKDRPDMSLPGPQTELIHAVVKANPRTIVVVNAGAPVSMPWIDAVPAVLEAYYPGQEGGSAVASLLFGDVNPSGKLTTTFPKRLEDNPSYVNYPGTKEVFYGEGIFVGYRYYEFKDIEPLFPFGFGLSYTTFVYSDLKVTPVVKLGEKVKVSFKITNTGKSAGKEAAQVYVHDEKSSLVRPLKELKGFKKVTLEPGESQGVELELDQRALSFYDPDIKQWVAEPGEFEIRVGSSSRDIHLKAKFNLA